MSDCQYKIEKVVGEGTDVIHAAWSCPSGMLFVASLCGGRVFRKLSNHYPVTCKKCLAILEKRGRTE